MKWSLLRVEVRGGQEPGTGSFRLWLGVGFLPLANGKPLGQFSRGTDVT